VASPLATGFLTLLENEMKLTIRRTVETVQYLTIEVQDNLNFREIEDLILNTDFDEAKSSTGDILFYVEDENGNTVLDEWY